MLSKRDKKKFERLAYKLLALCEGDLDLEPKARDILSEFRNIDGINLSKKSIMHMYELFHAFRGFETGVRTFLLCHGVPLDPDKDFSLGRYLIKLQDPGYSFTQINSRSKTFLDDNVKDPRNHYLHTAGKYPSKNEKENIIRYILLYFEEIISLSNKK